MTDTYNYAYDHTQENSCDVPAPPSYDMSIIKQQQPRMPKPTAMMESSPNTVRNTDVKSSSPSNIPLCRIFLIIAASFIIGCAFGGTILYFATRQGPNAVEDSSGNHILVTASQCPTTIQYPLTCPTCPTCQTFPTGSAPVTDLPVDCQEVMDRGILASGEYMISPLSTDTAFPVWCDMETDGGGWTVFQRRRDGSEDFYLGWEDYTNGFGDVNAEHWLGNQKIHQITSQGDHELRIDMADFEGNNAYAQYSNFKVGGLNTNFMLTVGGYSGDAGDSLSYHNNRAFSTNDVDNDASGTSSCATVYEGAWWYVTCHYSNLNGRYLRGTTTSYANGVVWRDWKGYYYSLKVSVMKMRRLH